MKIPFYKKASFWHLVIQSGQIILGTFQGITLAVEKNIMDVRRIINFNSKPHFNIAEEIDVVITSSSPVNVTTEVTPKPEV